MVKEFKGKSRGVRLYERGDGDDDRHVMVQLLSEDDENWRAAEDWFESTQPFSSYWIKDLIDVLVEADIWIKNNCDPDMYDGKQYGFKFRK